MKEEIREEVFSGFCRTYNQAQTVTCEFLQGEQAWSLMEVDCGYRRCIHKGSCEVAKQIRQMEETGERQTVERKEELDE